MNLNRVILAGRLTKDVDFAVTEKSGGRAFFTIAVNKYSKNNKETTNFIKCKAFGNTAINIGKFFKKGRPIFVEGELQQNKWVDKEQRQREDIIVMVKSFEFIDSKSKNEKEAVISSESDENNFLNESAVDNDDVFSEAFDTL